MIELLKWVVDYGKPELLETFKKLKGKGRKTPLDILPSLDPFQEWYFDLYSKLGSQRNANGYISASEVIAYCQTIELIDPIEDVINSILEIDSEVKFYLSLKEGSKNG